MLFFGGRKTMKMHQNVVLFSDFTIDPLVSHLEEESNYTYECSIAPIKQLFQVVLNANDSIWTKKNDVAVVWTKLEAQSSNFLNLLMSNQHNIVELKNDVKQYANIIQKLSEKVNIVIHPIWTLPSYYRGNGSIDLNSNSGIAYTLMQMNLYLIDCLSHNKNIFFVNSQRWYAVLSEADDDRLWYTGKIPYSYNFFKMAANEIEAVINAVYGKAKKLIVLDLDNTLWGGIIGDDGLEGIQLGGIDPIGEAFVDFQKSLLALKNRGILLAIVSKNEEINALEVFEKHPEMVLKKSDFVGWRINWQDKAANILELISELNIGLDSVVFIDDNPHERDRVKQAIPQLTVPDWPADPFLYKSYLNKLNLFDRTNYSLEDSTRTELYQNEQLRKKELVNAISLENWLESLDIELTYQECNQNNLNRSVQLLNKTNQFNLCTRRLTENEFSEFLDEDGTRAFLFNCQDRIGSYGSIGLVTFRHQDQELHIKDFILSCRSMGKNVEYAMINVIHDFAMLNKIPRIKASYIPTAKNKPCEVFLQSCNYQALNDTECIYDFSIPMESPKYIKM